MTFTYARYRAPRKTRASIEKLKSARSEQKKRNLLRSPNHSLNTWLILEPREIIGRS